MTYERPRISLLFDRYGSLLTGRQRSVLELYYEQDLSLGEVAEQLGVSRQAVHDILHRAGDSLEGYEEQLGLVERHLYRRQALQEALEILERSACPGALRVRQILEEVLEKG